MIYILLDSSSSYLTVGIADENKVIDFVSYEAWQTQSEHMIPELEKLLDKYGYSKDDIGAVIFANGPGSYTGVRIALTVAKVMATALQIKVYPVSSLRVLKCANKPSICLINARSDRSYFGVYEGEKIIEQDRIIENKDLLEYISSHKDYVLCGDLRYLQIEGYKSNVAEEMFSLRNVIDASENPLGIRPTYMKE